MAAPVLNTNDQAQYNALFSGGKGGNAASTGGGASNLKGGDVQVYNTLFPASKIQQPASPAPATNNGNLFQQAGNFIGGAAKAAGGLLNSIFNQAPNASLNAVHDYVQSNSGVKSTLQFVQDHILAPVFEKNPYISPFLRGAQQGVDQEYLGSVDKLQKIMAQPVAGENTAFGKGERTVGNILGHVMAFIAGGEVLRGIGLGKAALPILFATLGQTGDSSTTTAIQRIEQLPVDTVAGWLFSQVPGAKKLISPEALKQALGASAIVGGQGFTDALIKGLPPKQAAQIAAKAAVIAGLFHVAATATGLVAGKLTESSFKQGSVELTPQQARDQVINSNLEKTPDGQDIIKKSIQAEAQGKNIKITGQAAQKSAVAGALNLETPHGIRLQAEIVEPTGGGVLPNANPQPEGTGTPGSSGSQNPLEVQQQGGITAPNPIAPPAAAIGGAASAINPVTPNPLSKPVPIPPVLPTPGSQSSIEEIVQPHGAGGEQLGKIKQPQGAAGPITPPAPGTSAAVAVAPATPPLPPVVPAGAGPSPIVPGGSSQPLPVKTPQAESSIKAPVSSSLPTTEGSTNLSPHEAASLVFQNNIEGTPVGMEVLKNVAQAQRENSTVTITKDTTGKITGSKLNSSQTTGEGNTPADTKAIAPYGNVEASGAIGAPGNIGAPLTGARSSSEITNHIQEHIAGGNIEHAQSLHTEYSKSHELAPFHELQQQVEDTLYGEVDEVRKELTKLGSGKPTDDPTNIIKDIAEKMAKHFNAPGARLKLTGKHRTYTARSGQTLLAGGDAKEAFDRLIYATDIEGLHNNVAVLHDKFDKVFTEINSRIKDGSIDGADYEQFKETFRELTRSSAAHASRSGATNVSSTRQEEPKTSNSLDTPSSSNSQTLKTSQFPDTLTQQASKYESFEDFKKSLTTDTWGKRNAIKVNLPLSVIAKQPLTSSASQIENRKIIEPVEVNYDPVSKKYTLQDGQHRFTQAVVNGDKIIPAKVTITGYETDKTGNILKETDHLSNPQDFYKNARGEMAINGDVQTPPAPTEKINIPEDHNINPETSVQLNVGIDPGIKEFFKADVFPKVKVFANAAGEFKGMVAPYAKSESAELAANAIVKARARIANFSGIENTKFRKYAEFFETFKDEENIKNISEYEKTGHFKDAPKGYDEFYKQSTDLSRSILQEAYKNNPIGYIENYVRRAFIFDSKKDEAAGLSSLQNFAQSLSGSSSPTKHRVLNMPLDEALKNMEDRGINVRMSTTNPELLRQWSMVNAQRALTYGEVWRDLKDRGLISFIKPGDKIPEGFQRLEDRAAEVFFPSEAGIVKAGQYFADPHVARILNNAISAGLEDSATFRGLRIISNTMNQFQLGVSGFHFLGTAINAAVSDIALGLKNVFQGKIITGGRRIGTGVIPFASFGKDLYLGKSIIDGLKQNSPEAYKFLNEKLSPGGGRLGLDERYRMRALDNLHHAVVNSNYIGAIIRIPGAVVDLIGRPLMEYAIPRVKIGAFLELAENKMANLPPDTTPEKKQQALVEAWRSIDNRFGQLVYDNLFWHKAGKDVAMLATRSVGWNLGTIRELGGAISDLNPKKIKEQGVTDRMWYAIALPLVVGLMSVIYQYMKTGKGPQELKDFFYPKNGLKDKNGNEDRSSFPTYMKDVFAYGKDPIGTVLHKTSPLISMITELITNKDYYGDLIRNPNDPLSTQLQQLGAHIFTGVLPFSLQQILFQGKEGASQEQKAENFFGIIPAPRSVVKSDKDKAIQKALELQRGLPGPRTPEQVATSQLKTQARTDIQNGTPPRESAAYLKLISDGTLNTARKRELFVKEARLAPNDRILKHLNKQDRIKIKTTYGK